MGAKSQADDTQELAIRLFNLVWELLEKPDRTRGEEDTMLHGAHAARFHWAQAGTAKNVARSEWQCSRVYAVLGRAEPALFHARRCLELCEAPGDFEDFDLPFAHEALARAHALAGAWADAADHERRARELAQRIADDDDREILLADLASLPRR